MSKKNFCKTRNHKCFNLNITSMIILSSLCLVSGLSSLSFETWSWFTDTATMNAIIQVANYDITTQVKSDTDDMIISESTSMEYYLTSPNTYTVTLTANGTATTGFCEIIVDGKIYYTEAISTNEGENTFTFTIDSFTDGTIKFNPKWGSYDQGNMIKNGDVIKIGDETDISEDITINTSNQIPTIEESLESETTTPETDVTEEDGKSETIKPETDVTEEDGKSETIKPETDVTEEIDESETITPETNITEETTSSEDITIEQGNQDMPIISEGENTNSLDKDIDTSDEIESEVLEN